MGKECFTQKWLESSSPNPGTTDGQRPHDEGKEGFAARLYSLCRSVLRGLCSQEQSSPYFENLQPLLLREELAKFHLWGHGFSPGELDAALDYSDDARYLVLDALADIGRILLREISRRSDSALNVVHSRKSQELKDLIEQTKIITADRGREDEEASISDDDDDNNDDNEDGEPEEDSASDNEQTSDMVHELETHLQCLGELGSTLQQNLLHARKSRIRSAYPPVVPFHLSSPAAVYVSMIREKFRNAQDHLVHRLGEANWQRHQAVREQLKRSPIKDDMAVDEDQDLLYSVFRPHTTFHDSGIGTSVPAHTNQAPSHASFQSSKAEGEHGSVRVPPTPAAVKDGEPFQCPFCGQIVLKIKNRIDWKMHVFADLSPYICTFASCEMELAKFPTRAAWADHEFSEHRVIRWWECFECNKKCHSEIEWKEHLDYRHKRTFIGAKYHVAEKMASKKRAKAAETEECPLCQVTLERSRREFVKHVGKHMEEIALTALPREVDEESGVDSTPVAESSSCSSCPWEKVLQADQLSDSRFTDIGMHTGINLPDKNNTKVPPIPTYGGNIFQWADLPVNEEGRTARKARKARSEITRRRPSQIYDTVDVRNTYDPWPEISQVELSQVELSQVELLQDELLQDELLQDELRRQELRRQEQLKQENLQQEEVRQEEVKKDMRQEKIRGEETRGEEVRGEEVRGEEVRREEVRGEEVRGEEVRGKEVKKKRSGILQMKMGLLERLRQESEDLERQMEKQLKQKEQLRQEKIRGEEVRGEEVRGEEVRGEEVRGEEVKGEEVKRKEVKREEVKGEEVKGEEVRGEEVRGKEVKKKRSGILQMKMELLERLRQKSEDLERQIEKQLKQKEQLRQEKIRGEEVRGEEVRGEEVRGEEVKGEEVKRKEVKRKEVKGEEVKGEEVKGEEVKGKKVKGEEVKEEEVKGEEIKGEKIREERKRQERIEAKKN